MRVYLDNCCYNRPFDEQTQLKVLLETEAKLRVQSLMRNGDVEYVWSGVLDYEIRQSPFRNRKRLIRPWKAGATLYVRMDAEIISRGSEIMLLGVKKKDAVHLACAERNGDVEYVWSGVLDYEIRGGQSCGLRDGGSVMKAMTDNELLTICFDALVERVGYVGTERFIAVMNREPEDYTRWRENQPDEEESIEELGAKIMELESANEELVNA